MCAWMLSATQMNEPKNRSSIPMLRGITLQRVTISIEQRQCSFIKLTTLIGAVSFWRIVNLLVQSITCVIMMSRLYEMHGSFSCSGIIFWVPQKMLSSQEVTTSIASM